MMFIFNRKQRITKLSAKRCYFYYESIIFSAWYCAKDAAIGLHLIALTLKAPLFNRNFTVLKGKDKRQRVKYD